jgi:hypothetical protein
MRWLCKLARGLAVMTLAGAALLIGAAGSARVRPPDPGLLRRLSRQFRAASSPL